MNTIACPCGLLPDYEECCGRYIDKGLPAPTPESLMRSRYSAYARANTDYLLKTMRGKPAQNFDPVAAHEWANTIEWLKLVVLSAPLVPAEAVVGQVDFLARFRELGQIVILQELSFFEKIAGIWYYVSGKSGTKVPPNASCPCGSTKKFKKCCGSLT
jgi:SEC-C motif-containing protein